MIVIRQKGFSNKKREPKFPPGFHFDGIDEKGNKTCIPAYIDENGKAQELTQEIWDKYHKK